MLKRLMNTLAACATLCMTAVACANEAPDVEATFGDTEGPPPDDTAGDTDSPEDYCVQGDGSLDPAVSNPGERRGHRDRSLHRRLRSLGMQ
jgi:hypothetical protein